MFNITHFFGYLASKNHLITSDASNTLHNWWMKFLDTSGNRKKKRNIVIGTSIVAVGMAVSCYAMYKYYKRPGLEEEEDNNDELLVERDNDERELSSVGEAIEFINQIKLELSSVVNNMILDENDSMNVRVIVCVIYIFSIANILSRVSSSDLEIIREIKNVFSEEITSEIFDFFMYVAVD